MFGLQISRKRIVALLAVVLLAVAAGLLFVPREDKLTLLYATAGEKFDQAGWDSLRQSTLANLKLERQSLADIRAGRLSRYDVIYLDPGLHGSDSLQQAVAGLEKYVRQGGHLYLGNELADDFPLDFLGAAKLVDVPAPPQGTLPFEYPQTDPDLAGLQTMFHLFSDNFTHHIGIDSMPGFHWGQGIVPSTAQTLVAMGDVSLYTVNQVGRGSVFFSGTFLPNRYYITGYDMQSGTDPTQGFAAWAAQENKKQSSPTPHAAYFDLSQLPQQPYFNFTFAAANTLFRTEYLAYVSKDKYGYAVKKVFGPNGRPAMAYQNHYEAMPGIAGEEGIQWAELLKQYNQIPSFSLVRASFNWGQWKESVAAHLNIGTSDAPEFVGWFPNSFYSSGTGLVSDGKTLSLAAYPEYKSLGDPIELPYRAYPAVADVDGDGRVDLLAGSADGEIYFFRSLGEEEANAAAAWQPLPEGAWRPDGFAAPVALTAASGQPLSVGAFAAVAVGDVTGDELPDLVLGGGDGVLRLAAGVAADAGGAAGTSGSVTGGAAVNAGVPEAATVGANANVQADAAGIAATATAAPSSALPPLISAQLRFTAPQPMADAAGAPLAVAANAAPTIADLDGDGIADLVVGDAVGRVHFFRGQRASDGGIAFAPDRVLLQLDATYAAPSVKDMNGDGKPDLVIGNNEGDLRIYLQYGSRWRSAGVIEGESSNPLGSKAIVGGHNSVPLWYDINHDGKIDLLVGQLEFGMPIPTDAPDFPYRAELDRFIDYAKTNHLLLYPHLFVHNYESNAQEQEELRLHRQAFAQLGIPWGGTGTNQHTWRINNPARLQTLRNENAADLWYNFGFASSDAPSTPNWGNPYVWGLPFLLSDKQLKQQPMVLHTPTPYLRPDGDYANTDVYQAFVALDMPIDYFEHIEYHFPDKTADLLQFVTYLDKLRTSEDYNFVTEQQMAQSFLTALQGKVRITETWGTYLWSRFKDLIGRGTHFTRTIHPITNGVAAEAQNYAGTLGVVVEPGAKLGQNPLRSTADIFTRKGLKLYTAIPAATRITIDWSSEPMHLVRANVPVAIEKSASTWTIHLNADGMQQIKLYSLRKLTLEGDSLKVDTDETQHTYTVTHFGDKTTIQAHLQ